VQVAAALPRWVLSQGELLKLRDACGVEIRCRAGRLWITEQGSPDDVWLTTDEAYTCSWRGLTLVGAELDSVVEFSLAHACANVARASIPQHERHEGRLRIMLRLLPRHAVVYSPKSLNPG
jgi:Protein of unknown function (DUF2917)